MSMCESILTIALVCTVKYLHYCDYYYTLGNDSQSTPKLIAYPIVVRSIFHKVNHHFSKGDYNAHLLVIDNGNGAAALHLLDTA